MWSPTALFSGCKRRHCYDIFLWLTSAARPALKIAAIAAKQTASQRQTCTDAIITVGKAKTKVTRVAPKVWPTSRAVLCIPPALPVRCIGVAITMTILLGVWNIPKPMPHRAIRHAIFHSETLSGKNISKITPNEYTAIPMAAVNPGLCFSTKRAAMGDITIVARGHGVISRPVVISEKPRQLRKRNGNEIIARF